MNRNDVVVKDLGRTEYESVWNRMRDYTKSRKDDSLDQLWFTEHEPVYTLGQAGKFEHFLTPPSISVVRCDRGGQVTYHGPGQIVGYFLIDLNRSRLSVHDFVCQLEQTMIDTLSVYGITAQRLEKNPGVYVCGRKIGSLGIRVSRGCTYHGISLNVSMDLSPFEGINPCGIVGMRATDMRREGSSASFNSVKKSLEESYLELNQT